MTGFDDGSPLPDKRRYCVGDVTVTPGDFRVSKNGIAVRLEPKAFEVLVYLIERAGEVVSKQELLDKVWRGTFVTDNSLTRTVAQIRKALGDDLQTPRYIETIPTRGYRLVAPLVKKLDKVQPEPLPKKPGRLRFALPAAFLGVLAALSFLLIRKPPAAQSSVPAGEVGAHQLTGYLGLDLFPTFAPDGASLAYSSDHTGSLHIHVAQLRGGREIQVTSGNDGEIQPSWSPDGRTLAFVSASRGGIWLVPALGGAPVQLTEFGSRPEWSPDGRQIAFQSGVQVEFSATVFESFAPSALWIVEIATGHVHPLTEVGAPPGGHGSPHWRPDGKRIVFVSSNIQSSTIYSIQPDRSSLKKILTGAPHLGSALYGPDGFSLYYLENPTSGDSTLCRLSLSRDERPVGAPVVLRRSSPGKMHYLARSRDGGLMAWSMIEQTSNLMSIKLDDAGRPESEPKVFISNTNVRNTAPAFSSDGSQLAYCSIPAGKQSDVWLSAVDGTATRAVATEPGDKFMPHWSSDGEDLFYTVVSAGGWSLHSTSLRTGRSRKLFDLPDVSTHTSLSPDGRTLAFDRRLGGAVSVWTIALDGTALHRLAESAGFPVWSPEGDRLAVTVPFEGGSALGTISADGGSPRQIAPGDGESWPGGWSPDGKFIVFAGRREGVWNVWSAPSAGGESRRLTHHTSPATWVRFPVWSPDGAMIIYEMGLPTGNVWLSDNLPLK